MHNQRIYFDNNATTQVLPEVAVAMQESWVSSYANPSSAHSMGRESRTRVEHARDLVAELVGATPEQVLFTSGGTEANNQILRACLGACGSSGHITTSIVEHSSILKTCENLESTGLASVTYLPVNANGRIALDLLRASIGDRTKLISVQWANNETGVLQDVVAVGNLCRDAAVPFHVDAAQAVGKLEIAFEGIPVDFLTCSAHKIHGPKGVGAIIAKDIKLLKPLLYGGLQEYGLRAGTENLAGIVGFGAAAARRSSGFSEAIGTMRACRDRFENGALALGANIKVNAGGEKRLPNTSNLQFAGIEGMALVAQLDARGIMCSQSSACTNDSPEPSYVLKKMGLSEIEAYASVRFCFSELNTTDEVDVTLAALREILRRYRGANQELG